MAGSAANRKRWESMASNHARGANAWKDKKQPGRVVID